MGTSSFEATLLGLQGNQWHVSAVGALEAQLYVPQNGGFRPLVRRLQVHSRVS